tara:strand:- start:46 stop:216 length:171 start_codon:yes stop_codon:yes gene_type:complete
MKKWDGVTPYPSPSRNKPNEQKPRTFTTPSSLDRTQSDSLSNLSIMIIAFASDIEF